MKHQDLTSASHDGSTTMVEMSSMSSAGPATRCPGASWSSVHTGVSCRPPSSKYADVRTLVSGRGPARLQGGRRVCPFGVSDLISVQLRVGAFMADEEGPAGVHLRTGAQQYAVQCSAEDAVERGLSAKRPASKPNFRIQHATSLPYAD